ncbi:MAG: hypothetical protein ABR566_11340 [Pyrinomonadaceae bacterium]
MNRTLNKTLLTRRSIAFIILALAAFMPLTGQNIFAQSQSPQKQNPAAARPFTIEFYYKVKWGHFDEFLELYKKNHYPILLRQKKLGRILEMSAAYPINHANEAARWDFRFTIVYKDAATAHEDFDDSAIIKELYPDQERFKKEEQRRFELLLEHTDVPLFVEDFKKW